MKRFLKWVSVFLLVLVVLAGVGALAVRWFVSSDDIKALAESQASSFLGRTVRLQRLSPGLFQISGRGLVVEGTAKGPGGQGQPLLRVNKIEVILNPVLLLYKRISIVRLTLDGVSVFVSRDSRGRFSFQDIIDRFSAPAPKGTPSALRGGAVLRSARWLSPAVAEAAAESSGSGEEGSAFDVVIHQLDLRQVRLTADVAAQGDVPAFRASCLFGRFSLDKYEAGDPLDIELDGRCDAPARFRVRSSGYIDPRKGEYRANLHFDPFDILPVASMLPPSENFRLLGGRLGGTLSVTYDESENLRWESDLRAESVTAEHRLGGAHAWRRLRLDRVSLRSAGSYDLKSDSARVARLEFDFPFARGKLDKTLRWNDNGEDEVHASLKVSDLGALTAWVQGVAGFPVPVFGQGKKADLTLSAFRERSRGQAFIFKVASRLDAVDLTPVLRTLPENDYVHVRQLKAGGSVTVSFSSEQLLRWRTDLAAEGMTAEVRLGREEPWRKVGLKRAALRSAGSVNLKGMSANVERLEVELPFARLHLFEPGAKWNVAAKDEGKVRLKVTDLPALVAWARQLTDLPVRGMPASGALELTASFSRTHGQAGSAAAEVSAVFDAVDLAPFVRAAPLPENLRAPAGTLSGTFGLSTLPGKGLSWKTGLRLAGISGEYRPEPGGRWERLSLDSATIRGEGQLSGDSVVVERLEVSLPFATAKLRRKALWNVKGQDQIAATLSVGELRTAEEWLDRLSKIRIPPGPVGRKLNATLTMSRDRRLGGDFRYSVSAEFDPVQIGSAAHLLPIAQRVRIQRGEVSGKISLEMTAGQNVRWSADLRSKGISAEVHPHPDKPWQTLQSGPLRLRSQGSANVKKGSAEIASFQLELPFIQVSAPKKGRWNVAGKDELHVRWKISEMSQVAALAGSISGGSLLDILPVGTMEGNISFVRDRRNSARFAIDGSASTKLKSFFYAEYPNLDVQGEVRVKFDGKAIRLQVPELLLRRNDEPKAPPDITVKDASAVVSSPALFEGRFLAEKIRIEKVKARYELGYDNKSNIDTLLLHRPQASPAPAKPGPKASRPVPAKPAAPSPPATAAPAPAGRTAPAAGKPATGPAGRGGAPGASWPDVKIRNLEVADMTLSFKHYVRKGTPPVDIVVDRLWLVVEGFDSRMPKGRKTTTVTLSSRRKPPAVQTKMYLNPALSIPEVEGKFSLRQFDLTKLSPYVQDIRGGGVSELLIRGTRIAKGSLNLDADVSIRDDRLRIKGKAVATNLKLEADKNAQMTGLLQRTLQSIAQSLLRRENNTIPLRFEVSGNVQDPSFDALDAVAEAIVLSLYERLVSAGGNVKEVIQNIIGGAIGGITGSGATPKTQAGEPSSPAEKAPSEKKDSNKDLGKKLERTLKKGLEGLFGR